MKKLCIAIDFDDTIADTDWPKIKGLRPDAREVINKLWGEGHTIIIWTCREGENLCNAATFLAENRVVYNFLNTNCPERVAFYKSDCRKVGADVYIDDKGINGIPSWNVIYKMVQKLANA